MIRAEPTSTAKLAEEYYLAEEQRMHAERSMREQVARTNECIRRANLAAKMLCDRMVAMAQLPVHLDYQVVTNDSLAQQKEELDQARARADEAEQRIRELQRPQSEELDDDVCSACAQGDCSEHTR